jgi:hypothetical protein
MTTLATGGVANLDNRMALSGSAIYWTDANDGSNATGYVRRVSMTGGDASVLSSGKGPYLGIAVDAGDAFWTGFGSGTILTVSIDGGTPTTLVAGAMEPYRLAERDGEVYWTDITEQSVMMVAKAGGTPTLLAKVGPGLSPHGIAVDDTSVYWAASETPCSLGTPGCVVPPHLGRIMKAARGGGPVITLAEDQAGPSNITLDADNAYWVNSVGGEVMRVSKSGGSPVMLASSQTGPTDIAVDASSVYWGVTESAAGTGAVLRVPLGGGTPETLASKQSPASIVVDGTSVYWLNALGPHDTVMRLNPK